MDVVVIVHLLNKHSGLLVRGKKFKGTNAFGYTVKPR